MVAIVSAYCCVGSAVVGSTYYVLVELVQENYRRFAAKGRTTNEMPLDIVWQLTLKIEARYACQ